ncbi:MAG: hypothetical protein WAL38_19460, partial [Solirubrobacteraceae bacterium]
MGSPDGNGSSTGEGRKGALLLLRGRPTESDGTPERVSTLPSGNALRPDSNLNLGWYRPAAPEEKPEESGEQDERASHEGPGEADKRDSTVGAPAVRLDLGEEQLPNDPTDSPLGARRPRTTPVARSRRERRLARLRVPGAVATLRRLAPVQLLSGAREVRRRPVAVGMAVVFLIAVMLATVTALEQPSRPDRVGARTESALSANQLGRALVSRLASRPDALSGSVFAAEAGKTMRTQAQTHNRAIAR